MGPTQDPIEPPYLRSTTTKPMLIAPVGASCAGCSTLASYLVNQEGFVPVGVVSSAPTHSQDPESCSHDSHDQPPLANRQMKLFSSPTQLLDFVTGEWRSRFVLVDDEVVGPLGSLFWRSRTLAPRGKLLAFDQLDSATQAAFRKRPFFLLVGIKAPTLVRWQRFVTRSSSQSSDQDLESWIRADDQRLYNLAPEVLPKWGVVRIDWSDAHASVTTKTNIWADDTRAAVAGSGLLGLLDSADVTLINTCPTPQAFERACEAAHLASTDRLRPPWDAYFLSLCTLAAARSNCMKRRVGCVLVRDKRVLATGYNGTPRGVRNCNEGGCGRCNGSARMGASLTECLCLHAEENALLECGREKGGAAGTVLYCNTYVLFFFSFPHTFGVGALNSLTELTLGIPGVHVYCAQSRLPRLG